jgi:diguanylate cyclase (GGDEF)-like protein/PAS domain S-box-containing protein
VVEVLEFTAICCTIVYLVMHLLSRRRERMLGEARAGEARFRMLTELSADWFWETDAAHRITWLSGGGPVATLFGGAPTYGKRFWEIPRIDVDQRALEALLERLGSELPFFDLEISRTDDRGARVVHIISGQSRKDAQGQFLGYRGVGRDVTEQRRAERGLAAAKERLEMALDGGNLAEWHLDLESDELYVGDGWARFLGHGQSPSITRRADLARIIHPEDLEPARAALVRALKGHDEYDAEFRVRTRGGEWKWLHVRARVSERRADGRALRMSGVVADLHARRTAEAALREADRRYRTVADIAPHGIIVHHAGNIVYANRAAAQMLKARGPEDLVGRELLALFDESDVPAVLARRDELVAKAPHVTDFQQRHMRCLDGSPIVVEAAGVSYHEGSRVMVQAMFRDVTLEQRAREAMAQNDQRFRDVASVSGEYVWESDAEWQFSYLSERAEAVLGFSRSEILGRTLWEMLPLGEARIVRDWFATHGGEGKPFRELTHRMITKSGAVIWQSLSGVPLTDPAGRWAGYRGTAADVTPRKHAEARIEQLTTRDALTGLANRTLLAERVSQAIVRAAHTRGELALLAIDLDRYRLVNESLGHGAGDALLRAVAERLQNALRREDTLARIGGDDFVLLWNGVRSADEAAALAQRILSILGRPFTIEGATLYVEASVGIALYPRDGRDFGELLRNADAALYHAKRTGRGDFAFFAASMHEQAAEELRMENELKSALQRGELALQWHPVVHGSLVRGGGPIVGAEALVRWQHPTRGPVSPASFVPLAEDSGLIRELGDWTLEHALSQAGAWRRELPQDLWIAVNVSAAELAEGDTFVEKVRGALRAHGMPGERLELEVTERVLMSHLDENIRTLKRIGELGVRFAIDDFGTGYSSLAYLRELPIDKLKIDRSFLRGIDSDAASEAIARTIASLARTLGIAVAAEGVETAGQLERLLALGCSEWQGHYFSEPLDAQAFADLVSSNSRDAQKSRA